MALEEKLNKYKGNPSILLKTKNVIIAVAWAEKSRDHQG